MARGGGGQSIFVLPDLGVDIVIAAGNYQNGKTQEAEEILEKDILPNLEKKHVVKVRSVLFRLGLQVLVL